MSHSEVAMVPFILPLYQKMEKHLEAISISWKYSFKIQHAAGQGLMKLRILNFCKTAPLVYPWDW